MDDLSFSVSNSTFQIKLNLTENWFGRQNNTGRAIQARAKIHGQEGSPGLPCGWQEAKPGAVPAISLGSTVTGSWRQEAEVGIKFRYSDVARRS